MQINKISETNFQGYTILKSKNAKIINLLNDIDYDILRKAEKQQVRFDAPATSLKNNGFWTGLLTYGKDSGHALSVTNKKVKEKEISSLDDILEIVQFKKFKTQIQKYCQQNENI